MLMDSGQAYGMIIQYSMLLLDKMELKSLKELYPFWVWAMTTYGMVCDSYIFYDKSNNSTVVQIRMKYIERWDNNSKRFL